MSEHTFEALERIPREELERRWSACRALLAEHLPEADGMAVFSGPNMYWLTGTWTAGVFWLPVGGEPVLLVRRGLERARLESAVQRLGTFRSYSDVAGACRELGSPLGAAVAVDKTGLSWSLGEMLASRLDGVRLVPGEGVMARARAVKTGFELAAMRECGARHHRALWEMLPGRIRPGMTEREISIAAWDVFFELGHVGLMRMGAFGAEIFLGHVSAGDSANYPSVFDGPVGLRGEHPAVPFMGSPDTIWRAGEPLACDIGFAHRGYVTDKTQVYFAGAEGSMPAELERGHRFCVDVQAWLAEQCVPGAVPAEMYAHCMAWAEREGLAEGFMALGSNKVRFLGHGIGLVIDEFPALSGGMREPLKEGMVLALEPKYGVSGLGMVGVENTFEVTPSGARCLTGDEYGVLFVEP